MTTTAVKRTARHISDYSDADLLRAIGVHETVLSYGLARLPYLSADEQRAAGLGPALSRRLQAACELGKRVIRASTEGQPLRSSCAVYERLSGYCDAEQEHFIVMALDVRGRVLRETVVAKGSVDECNVNPRDVYREAIRLNASAVIVAHNHPSGDPTPSPLDRHLTIRLAEAGRMLGLQLLDHVIVARAGFASFRDDGVL